MHFELLTTYLHKLLIIALFKAGTLRRRTLDPASVPQFCSGAAIEIAEMAAGVRVRVISNPRRMGPHPAASDLRA